MKTRLFYLLTTIIFLSSCAAHRQRQITAYDHIENLNNGAILVRLQTGEKKVEALKKAGLEEKAVKAKETQETRNQQIVTAFKTNFNYCPVYFFYAPESAKVKAGEFNGVLFDTELKPISSLEHIPDGKWLMSELGQTQDPLGKNNQEKVNASKGVYSFVLKDRDFKQLARPFPYANRVYSDTPMQYGKAIANMNQNLLEFQTEAKIKKQKREMKAQRKALRNKVGT